MSSSDENEQLFSQDEQDDNERTAIRTQLSTLTFEELQKLKERIGAKVYNEALFGQKDKQREKLKVFKRENKNRPREMSSKKPVPMILKVENKARNKEIRDPRFDPLCGEFDKQEFSANYGFLSGMRLQDIKATKKELKETRDPERQKQLKRLLQRLNDQHRASKKSRIEKEKASMRKEQVVEEFKSGKQPHFKNKSEQRVEALVKQYEELRKEGSARVERHLKRRQQKIKKKSFKAPTGVS